jgi:predicted nucleic acid-binding protein
VKIAQAIGTKQLIAIDAAPIIYYVERNQRYLDLMRFVIKQMVSGRLKAVSASITLTEVLVKPIANNDTVTADGFRRMLLKGTGFKLIPITAPIAEQAAELRATYKLKTPDALQIAAAVDQKCDAFLTNDTGLKRVTEVQVLVLDELEI